MAVKKIRKIKGNRMAGVLMPVSALPSAEGIGTLGKGAYDFVDWLEKAGMHLWQVLPLLPTGFGDSPYQSYASNALNFYFIDFQILMGRLKHLERSGPKMYEIKHCETVASHCFRTALMALYLETDLSEQNIDVNKVIKMALIHDAGEAIIGDIVPTKWQKGKKISKPEKHKKELEAIISMSERFDVPFVWQTFNDIEQRKTLEASMVKDLDIFECVQQAYEYIKIYPEKAILREYIPYHQPRIKSGLVQNLIVGIKHKQDTFLTLKNLPTYYKQGSR